MKNRMMIMSILMVLIIPQWSEAQIFYDRNQERTGKWGFAMQTRYTTSRDFSGEGGSALKLDDNLGWGFGVDYHLHRNFELGMAFNWRSIRYTASVIDGDDPSSTSDYVGTMSVSTMAINGAWNVLDGPITPYVNGSLGWTLFDSNVVSGLTSGCWYDPLWGYTCGTFPTTYGRDTVTTSLGLGGRFQLNQAFYIRAGYEYGWIGEGSIDGTHMLRIDFGFLMN